MASLVCPNCEHRNLLDARFCSACGTSLTDRDAGEATESHDVEADEEPEPRVDDVGDGAAFVVHRGPKAGSRYALDEPVITVGRDADSTIFLDDVTVSRRHAEVRTAPDGTHRVTDVGSLNGTYVNRDRVEEAVLSDGDVVQIGRFKLVYRHGGAGD